MPRNPSEQVDGDKQLTLTFPDQKALQDFVQTINKLRELPAPTEATSGGARNDYDVRATIPKAEKK